MNQKQPDQKAHNYQGVKVLLTGGSGFIGAALRSALTRENAKLICPTRHEMDITNASACERYIDQHNPEIVFHLAADLSGRSKADDVLNVFQINTAGTVHLLEACRQSGVRTVLTCGTADEFQGGVNLYGVSRAAATLWAQGYHQFADLNVGVARVFMVYGPNQDSSFFLPALINSLLTGKPLDMSAGQQTRDYVWLDDIIQALLLLGLRTDLRGATYQIGTGVETSLLELIALVEEISGKKAPVNVGAMPYRKGGPFRLVGEPSKLLECTGYRPSTTLRQGLKRLLH